jgi:hypothetical protein
MRKRQNISIDPEVLEMLRVLSDAKKTTISGFITRMTIEEYEAKYPEIRCLKDPESEERLKAN